MEKTGIVVHCSATTPTMDWGMKEIDDLHRARGWRGIGYHWVIRRDGRIEQGRNEEDVGAHARGFNEKSIGVCLIGGVTIDDGETIPENNFTEDQFSSLKVLIKRIVERHPIMWIKGHRDLPGVAKACPSFDVEKFVWDWLIDA